MLLGPGGGLDDIGSVEAGSETARAVEALRWEPARLDRPSVAGDDASPSGRRTMIDDRALLEAAVEEDAATPRRGPTGPRVHELVAFLRPVVQARVTLALLRHARGRMIDDLVAYREDYAQSNLARLFERDWRDLRRWDRDRGLSLKNWVGMLVGDRMKDELRAIKRSPWLHQAHNAEFFAALAGGDRPDREVEVAEWWAATKATVLEGETELGRTMFELLFESDRSVAEIAELTGLSDAAIYQWRSRIRRTVEDAIRGGGA